MFEKKKCPICGKENLEEFGPNEKFFLFEVNSKSICKNCDCSFNEEDRNVINKGTKITKREFFSSIFIALEDIFHLKKLTTEQKKDVEKLYEGKIKTYYREVLDAQLALFYEIACSYNESEFFKWIEKNTKKNKLK